MTSSGHGARYWGAKRASKPNGRVLKIPRLYCDIPNEDGALDIEAGTSGI